VTPSAESPLDDAGLYWDADLNGHGYIAVAAATGRFIDSAGNERGFQAVFVKSEKRGRGHPDCVPDT